MTDARRRAVYEAKPGAVTRTFWMGYAVESRGNGIVKLEGEAPMSMADARQLMHRAVDEGADDLIRRFGF